MPANITQPVVATAKAVKAPASAWRARLRRHAGAWLRGVHILLFAGAAAAAWGLGLAVSPEALKAGDFPFFFAALVAAKAVAFELFRLHRASWRWFSLPDAAAVTVANTSGSVLAALALGPRIATSALAATLVIEWLASQALVLGSRMLYRALRETAGRDRHWIPRKRVFIYGAGRLGVNLLRQTRANPRSVYEIVGFIDDDPDKRHATLRMTPVLGNGDELPRLARLHEVDEILVAVAASSRETRDRFRELARFAGLPLRFPRPVSRAVGKARNSMPHPRRG